MPVSKTAKTSLLPLWESGVPLGSASIEFHPFLDSFAIRALRTHPANDPDILADDPRYRELCKGWLPRTWEARQKKLATTTKSGRVHLLGEIYAGNLSAIGFRTRADGSDELVPVPRQYFFFDEAGEREQRPDIHWSKGELTAGATSYFDIRIVRAPIEVEQLTAPPSAAKAAQSLSEALVSGQPHPDIGLNFAVSPFNDGEALAFQSDVCTMGNGRGEIHGLIWLYLIHPVAVKVSYIKRGARLYVPGDRWNPSSGNTIIRLSPFKGGTEPIDGPRALL